MHSGPERLPDHEAMAGRFATVDKKGRRARTSFVLPTLPTTAPDDEVATDG
jgi:hypothetical protein